MSTHVFAPLFDMHLAPPASARAAFAPELDVEPGEPAFALLGSGPPVPASEVETELETVEVRVRWGTQILTVAHVDAQKGFTVGERGDFALPDDVLGEARAPIVVARGGDARVVVPRRARGFVERVGAPPASIAALVAQGALEPSFASADAHEIALAEGMTVVLELGAERRDGTRGEPVTFEIRAVRAGKRTPLGLVESLAGGALGFVALSLLGHAAIVASMALFMPRLAADDAESIDRDQILLMQKLLNASAQRESELLEPEPTQMEGEASAGGGAGAPHHGESGEAGTTKPVTTHGRMAFKGTDHESSVPRSEQLAQAATFGMISFIDRDPNAPASPWGKEYQGADDASAKGAMGGASIDDAMGFGLGLWGTGEGGGGKADVIGLGTDGPLGGGMGGKRGWGVGPDRDGWGTSHGRVPGHHVAKAPVMRDPGVTSTNGRLPAEAIQRVVRQNFGRFRVCYEVGLRQNPGLSGRVATKFVIGRDGAVMQAQDAGSDLPDTGVVQCIVRSFNALSFPTPEGGVATVTYPIVLTPGD